MEFSFDVLIKILLAIALGGLIGVEREIREKAAGFRTLIFICLGSSMFTMLSINFAGNHDTARIAANIVSGVGFLGAGVILREQGRIKGLTTASIIWFVAAVGMAVGAGQFLFAIAATLIVFIILWIFPRVERLIGKSHETQTYNITCLLNEQVISGLEDIVSSSKLFVYSHKLEKHDESALITWVLAGRPDYHIKLREQFINSNSVNEFRY